MKIDRYYVDSDGNQQSNIVVRDHVSPMGRLTYPTDIAVEVTMGMFASRKQTIEIAEKICALFNSAE